MPKLCIQNIVVIDEGRAFMVVASYGTLFCFRNPQKADSVSGLAYDKSHVGQLVAASSINSRTEPTWGYKYYLVHLLPHEGENYY